MKKIFLSLALISLGLSFTNAQSVKKTKKTTVKTSTTKSKQEPNLDIDVKDVKQVSGLISLATKAHDFGSLNKGGNGTYEFKFTNSTNEPILIKDAKGSCGCTVPDFPKYPIAPGQSDKIKVTYDTQRLGQFNKDVTLWIENVSGTKKSTEKLEISGKVNE